jgi:cytochrome c biogenesis protein CcdA
LGEDVSELFAAEMRLMSLEMREEAKEAARASAVMVGAAVMAFLTLMLLAFAAAWGLAEVVPEGVAFLIVAVVVGIIAAVMGLVGRELFRKTEVVPRQAVSTMKEDVQWVKQQVS